jgi:uncharacterized surface protein with fasciclin (FAS1) repeats
MAKNIVQTARDAGNFSTLLKSLDQAGLRNVLEGKGPYTVFAPSDAAFGKVSKDKLDSWMKPGNKDKLAEVLKYHVCSGRMRSSQIDDDSQTDTLSGQQAKFEREGNTIRYAGAKIVNPDIECSNGVIHVIDRVVMPPRQPK